METADIPLMTQEEQNKITDEASPSQKPRSRMLRAWRFTIASGALAGTVVLLANIITLAVIYGRFDVADHNITFFTGSCKTASTVTTVAHVIINILSTILLAASNFSMQCLASPTRKEVDKAHSNRRWLSIGTPNIRNIFFVSKSKALLWLILAASSFPLHTVWNSTVFETRSTNDYLITAATEDFFNGTEWKYAAALYGSSMTHTEWGMASDIISHLQHEAISSRSGNSSTGLERLDVDDCIKAYAQDELSDRRHLLVVIDGHQYDTNGTVLGVHNTTYSVDGDPLFAWMCDKYALIGYDYIWKCVHNLPGKKWTLGDTTFNSYPGTPLNDAPIQYCYSETTPEKCKASIVPLFLIVVIICNVIKILCFLFTLRITKADPPLCTTGDAIQSFLQKPDPHTKGRCLVSKQDYESYISRSDEWQSRASNIGDLWDGGRWRWKEAIHLFQWLFYTACLSAVIIAGGVLYDPGRKGVKGSGIVALGIGQPRASFRATENGVSGLLTGFIEANVPQLIVSYIYLALNNMMTTMLAMAEWCAFSAEVNCKGKGLRVSSPVPNTEQVSTYTLSVPLKWGIPTAIFVTILHWLVSQTTFFAVIEVYTLIPHATSASASISDIFFSPLGMAISVSLGGASIFIIVGISIFKKFPGSIPLAGCCSASLAAACQPSPGTETTTDGQEFAKDLPYKTLKWGVVDASVDIDSDIGHATFDAENPTPLRVGKLYA